MFLSRLNEINGSCEKINPQLLNSLRRGLTLETSAFEFLYGGQLTLSTQLIKPNYLVKLPSDAAPQFL